MTERGDEHDLKPALLFMSILHADQAKAAATGTITISRVIKAD